MRRVSLIFIISVLMINIFSINIQATEDTAVENTIAEEEASFDDGLVHSGSVAEATARVIEIVKIEEIQNEGATEVIQTIKIRILDSDHRTEEYELDYNLAKDIQGNIRVSPFKVGDKIQVEIIEYEDSNTCIIKNKVRNNYLVILAIIFITLTIMTFRIRGLRVLGGIAFSIIIVYLLLIKAVAYGFNEVAALILTLLMIISVNYILLYGINKRVVIAIVCVFTSVMIIALIYKFTNVLLGTTGITEEIVQNVIGIEEIKFNFKYLVYIAIIISSLGIIMDLSISIVNRLDESIEKTVTLSWYELFKKGIEAGKIVTMNKMYTILYFNIGQMSVLMTTYSAMGEKLKSISNYEGVAHIVAILIAEEIGIVISTIMISVLYALFNKDKKIYKTTPENRLNGNRSLKL